MNYLRERTIIPRDHLIEIRYEDFIQNPLEQLSRTYQKLHLGGFTESEKKFVKYIESQTHWKPQRYVLSAREKEKIYTAWKFAFDSFLYEK
jgi:hypothetical protein